MRTLILAIVLTRVSVSLACTPAPMGTWERVLSQMGYEGRQDPKALKICEEMSFSSSKTRCRETIQSKLFTNSAIAHCASLPSDHAKQECLEVMADGYFNDGAMEICRGLSSLFERPQCLTQIRDKAFDPDDLALCRRGNSDMAKQNCLVQHGLCIVKR